MECHWCGPVCLLVPRLLLAGYVILQLLALGARLLQPCSDATVIVPLAQAGSILAALVLHRRCSTWSDVPVPIRIPSTCRSTCLLVTCSVFVYAQLMVSAAAVILYAYGIVTIIGQCDSGQTYFVMQLVSLISCLLCSSMLLAVELQSTVVATAANVALVYWSQRNLHSRTQVRVHPVSEVSIVSSLSAPSSSVSSSSVSM